MSKEYTFIKIKLTGIIYLLCAAALLLFSLFSQGYFVFVLWLILPMFVYSSIAGYYLVTLRLRRRAWVIIPAILSIFFSLARVLSHPQAVVTFSQSPFYRIFLAASLLSGMPFPLRVIAFFINMFIIYVFCFSEERILFQMNRQEAGGEIRIKDDKRTGLILVGIFLAVTLAIFFTFYSASPHKGREKVINTSAHKIEQLEPRDYPGLVNIMEDVYAKSQAVFYGGGKRTADRYLHGRKKNEIESDKVFSILPEKGRHGASVAIMPASGRKVALYRQAHRYKAGYLANNGVVFNSDSSKVIEKFELSGFQYEYVKEAAMPTENVLVLKATIPPQKTGFI